MRYSNRHVIAGFMLCTVGILQGAEAETITVCLDGSCDFADPAAAAASAVSGDVIEIAAGTYLLEEAVSFIIPQVTVRGAVDAYGDPATILDGQGSIIPVGTVYADQAVFENLVVTNGYSDYGGGARFIASNDVVVRNCHFRNNHANWDGGGLRMSLNTTLTLVDCEITGNTADHPTWPGQSRGAGANVAGGTLTLVRTQVCDNVESSDPGRQIAGVNEGDLVGFGACIADICKGCVTTNLADLNFDGSVDGADLGLMLSAWGVCSGGPCLADLNGDGLVNGADLGLLLVAFG